MEGGQAARQRWALQCIVGLTCSKGRKGRDYLMKATSMSVKAQVGWWGGVGLVSCSCWRSRCLCHALHD